MLRAIGISYYTFRKISSVASLVANPAKLQKTIILPNIPRWLHQDVKIQNRKHEGIMDDERIAELSKQAYSNTQIMPSNQSIVFFCNEFISRLGLNNFKNFIQFHEFHQSSFTYLQNYQQYLKTCYKLFEYDSFLLNSLVMCDFRKINKDSIARAIFDGDESETKTESQTAYILKMVPDPRPIFDDYENLIDKKIPSELVVEDENCTMPKPEIHQRNLVLDSILTLNQLPSKSKKTSNWIYFHIECGTDDLLNENSLKKAFKSINVHSVKDLKLFNVNKLQRKVEFVTTKITSEEIKKSLSEEIDLQRLSILAKTNRMSAKKRPEEMDKELTGDFSTNTSEIEKNLKNLEKLVAFSSKANVRNRGYGFIELNDYETKQMILKESYRLFGLEIEKSFLVIDDADKKKTIQLNNVPWNLSPSFICEWVNNYSKQKGTKFMFGIDKSLENFLSDASYVYVKTNSFLEAYEFLQLFNLSEFYDKTIYADFKRGCGRYVDGCYFENFISPYHEEQQRNHIQGRTRRKEEYIKKYSESSKNHKQITLSSHK